MMNKVVYNERSAPNIVTDTTVVKAQKS